MSDLITKQNLDLYLKEVAKEFRKLNGSKMPGEVILVGGAAVLANYGFRDATTDIDAIIKASSAFKDAAKMVAEKNGLAVDWFNDDFKKTESFSNRLFEVSQHYKTYSNVLSIRTISANYLVAMKLRSGRAYKKDQSDIIGIINEEQKNGGNITFDSVVQAYKYLYNDRTIEPEMNSFLKSVFKAKDLVEYYQKVRNAEKGNRELLIEFEKKYPDRLKTQNVNSVLSNLNNQGERESVLKKLREAKSKNISQAQAHEKDSPGQERLP